MKKVHVEVQRDHLERLISQKSPLAAVSELIWNALDGDASSVEVALVENGLSGLEEIRVSDNGHGIPHQTAIDAFEDLGNSWKAKPGARSPGGRRLHGSHGEGRFSAFALGSSICWSTRWRDGTQLRQYEIKAIKNSLGTFEIADPTPIKGGTTGTDVTVREIEKEPRSLRSDDAPSRFSEIFALYLRTYPSVRIRVDGKVLDPAASQRLARDYEQAPIVVDGKPYDVKLTVIEWNHKVAEREIHLCDDVGMSLHSVKVGIHAPGFHFTAFLRSEYMKRAGEKGLLSVSELTPHLADALENARTTMREHFRRRAAEEATSVVQQWKTENVYPYQGGPRGPVDEAERQVFDVIALQVNEYLPGFSTADPKSKKLSLHMLKTAIERSPQETRRIIQEVLNLPQDKQAEMVELLERTSLSAIISAARVVVDRLDFLAGLEVLLFDPVGRDKVKERKHLHRILAENTWIFGESFNLSVDDQSLTEVLRKHLEYLGKDRTDLAPVTTIDGETGIVDLMLSKRIPQARAEDIEHLVVELKRPKVAIDDDVMSQVKKYALAVAKDERFRDTHTSWTFWALSNEIREEVRPQLNQEGSPPGRFLKTANIAIWVKSWGQVVEECRARLRFFQDRLGYAAQEGAGLQHLQKLYDKYLPNELKKAEKTDPAGAGTGAPQGTPAGILN